MGTKVSIYGFELEFSDNISIGDIYEELKKTEDKNKKFFSKTYLHYVDTLENYICGLVITYRGHKKSIVSLRDGKGNLVFKKDQLRKKESGTEASLFILNPDSNRGMLLYYVSGGGLGLYKHIFRTAHNKVRSRLRTQKTEELTEQRKDKDKRKAKKAARDLYSGELEFSITSKRYSMDELLKLYRDIQAVEVDIVDLLDGVGKFKPVVPILKGLKSRAGFINRASRQDIVQAIDIFRNRRQKYLKLIGRNMNGEEVSYVLENDNKIKFDQMEYDEYVDLLPNGVWREYKHCKMMTKLLSRIKSSHPIFGSPPVDRSWANYDKHSYAREHGLDISE